MTQDNTGTKGPGDESGTQTSRNRRNRDTRVSLFPNLRTGTPIEKTMGEIATLIAATRGELAELTRQTREEDINLLAETKMNHTPAVAFSGVFSSVSGNQRAGSLEQPSGLVVLELTLRGAALPGPADTFSEAVVLAYDSVSLRGTKVVMAVTPAPRDNGEHQAAQQAAAEHMRDTLTGQTGMEVHTPPGIARVTLLAHDPAAQLREQGVVPVRWTPDGTEKRGEPDFDMELWAAAVRMAHHTNNRPVMITKENVSWDRQPLTQVMEFIYPQWNMDTLRQEATGIYHQLLLAGPDPGWEPELGAPPPAGPED